MPALFLPSVSSTGQPSVHDQIGAFLWDEDMLSKLRHIKNHLLKKKGGIIPFKIELYWVPTCYRPPFEKSLSFWDKPRYGFDWSSFKKKMFFQNISKAASPSVINLKDSKPFLSQPKLACSLDLRKENRIPSKVETTFQTNKRSRLTGMCAFLKIYLDKNHFFSTQPRKINTHWGQIFLPSFNPLIISRPSLLKVTLFPKKDPKDWRFFFQKVYLANRPSHLSRQSWLQKPRTSFVSL